MQVYAGLHPAKIGNYNFNRIGDNVIKHLSRDVIITCRSRKKCQLFLPVTIFFADYFLPTIYYTND